VHVLFLTSGIGSSLIVVAFLTDQFPRDRPESTTRNPPKYLRNYSPFLEKDSQDVLTGGVSLHKLFIKSIRQITYSKTNLNTESVFPPGRLKFGIVNVRMDFPDSVELRFGFAKLARLTSGISSLFTGMTQFRHSP
jgi:hypothetical protein